MTINSRRRLKSSPRLAEHFEDLGKQTHAAHFAMWIFLGSEVLLFAGLFALYAAYRVMYPADFASATAHNNVLIGTTNTFILITSSLTVVLSVHAIRGSQPRRTAYLLLASMLLGIVFLVLKGVEYAEHFHQGIFPGAAYRFAALPTWGAQLFFTLYFLMTGLHALHVIGGLVVLGWVLLGCLQGEYSGAHHTPVELGALYWHLIDIIWIFLWPLLYLIHP
jgi:cytochrome c oxidase subunit III